MKLQLSVSSFNSCDLEQVTKMDTKQLNSIVVIVLHTVCDTAVKNCRWNCKYQSISESTNASAIARDKLCATHANVYEKWVWVNHFLPPCKMCKGQSDFKSCWKVSGAWRKQAQAHCSSVWIYSCGWHCLALYFCALYIYIYIYYAQNLKNGDIHYSIQNCIKYSQNMQKGNPCIHFPCWVHACMRV